MENQKMDLSKLKDDVCYLKLSPKARYLLLELLLMADSKHEINKNNYDNDSNGTIIRTDAAILNSKLFPYERKNVVKLALAELERAEYLEYSEQNATIILKK